ncbi:D-alanyl-D-alanine carboxypeptidase family protein [Virgibacillus sp. W0181]|uniref:D-alanyl-D-alanine carboxypeptidase family protein n=1 Tax=Virgibacillus sp. W0181 TaxID=3391581 RepID=UPI003F4662B4
MRISLCFIFLLFIVLYFPGFVQASVDVSANNAVLMEQSTGRVLYEKQAHEKKPIASITKVMTAIIAIESGQMDKKVKTSRRAIYTEGSSIYLEQGEKMKLEDLVYGLMLRSGNDAAVAISEQVGGSVEGFVYLMNEKAKWLGMTNTNFTNPHGLHDDSHFSTAYDMALLMQYAMNNEQFKKISGTITHTADNRSYAWKNKNKLLTYYYDHCTGGKTGFTKKSGRTLLTTAKKDDFELIAVTLNASDDWRDHIQMFEWGYKNFKLRSLENREEINFKLKETNDLFTGYLQEPVYYPLTDDEYSHVHSYIRPDDKTTQGVLGQMIFSLKSKPIHQTTVYSNPPRLDRNYSTSFFRIIKSIAGLEING